MLSEGRRVFSSEHVCQALGSDVVVWERLAGEEGGVPLVETLSAPAVGAPGSYQFEQLSFQEALFAQAVG